MKAVITSAICPLYMNPSVQCELADEGLFGHPLEVEEAGNGWYHVKTHYRYEGYAQGIHLSVGERNADRWATLEKKMATHGYCTVMAAPSVQSWVLATVPRGGLVTELEVGEGGGWVKVGLPDGSEGYMRASHLGAYPTTNGLVGDELREALCSSALSYMGAHYRWGGKSMLGIDCSGLTAMAYLLNGILIYRDARLKEGFPMIEIPKEQMAPGDLLFFPGHVALYLGEGKYVHSTGAKGSDGVVINSLNPQEDNFRQDLLDGLNQVGSFAPFHT